MRPLYERPVWVRRLNAMGDAVGGARHAVPVDAEDLVARAAASLGTDDFGDFGAGDWRAAFARIAGGLDDAPLHTLGRLMTREELLRCLRTRLLLAGARAERPAIAEERIAQPVIVTGPARSGTTLLFELLALDPGLRAPAAWEALHPVPWAAEASPARRERIAECEQEFWADVQPEFAAIHELRSDLPVECVTLTAPCFAGPHWSMCLQVPDLVLDVGAHYAFHEALLQTLQHGAPPRAWLLKTPAHLYSLPQLFETYPDAWVVQTHRDPAKTMPSTVSTAATVRWMRSDAVDVAQLAQVVGLTFGAALLGVIEQRSTGAVPARFVDVHFQDLLQRPVETIRAVCEGMGRPFSDEHARAIREYLARKPRGAFGVHRYTAAQWGFDAAELRTRLAPYIEHHGVALED